MQTLNNKLRAQELLDAGAITQEEADLLFDSYRTVEALNKLLEVLKAARREAMYNHRVLQIGNLELVEPSDILNCTLAEILAEMTEG